MDVQVPAHHDWIGVHQIARSTSEGHTERFGGDESRRAAADPGAFLAQLPLSNQPGQAARRWISLRRVIVCVQALLR